MQLTNSIKSITIGSFDGLHLAHQELISKADMIVVIERDGGYLTPGHKRARYSDKPITIYHLDEIKSFSPEQFVHKLTDDFPMLERIVVGYDFYFGKDKGGDGDSLEELFGGEVLIVDEVCKAGIPVHSRTIRSLLAEGDLHTANTLLGRYYRIDAHIIKGQGLGAKELVPTLNLQVSHFQLPANGVYASRTLIDKRWMRSITFLGHRVTADGSFAIETHIIGEDIGVITGEVSVEFIELIRHNKKFDSLAELKEQIIQDIQKVPK